jgi:hypothetical protein
METTPRFPILVAGTEERTDWRPLWAALAMLEIIEGPLEILVHPLPGVSRLATRIARAQDHALTVLEGGRTTRWWPEGPVPRFVLFYAADPREPRINEIESHARQIRGGYHHLQNRDGLQALVESRVWARFPTIYDLLSVLEPRSPLVVSELVEAIRTKEPKWIVPLVEEIMHRRHEEAWKVGAGLQPPEPT